MNNIDAQAKKGLIGWVCGSEDPPGGRVDVNSAIAMMVPISTERPSNRSCYPFAVRCGGTSLPALRIDCDAWRSSGITWREKLCETMGEEETYLKRRTDARSSRSPGGSLCPSSRTPSIYTRPLPYPLQLLNRPDSRGSTSGTSISWRWTSHPSTPQESGQARQLPHH